MKSPSKASSPLNHWPDTNAIAEELTRAGLSISYLRFQEEPTTDHRHAKMIGTDPHGDEKDLFIKLLYPSQPEGNKERFAHLEMAPLMRKPITSQFLAYWEDANHRYWVTEDVSATHRCPGSPKPDITEYEFISVIETYARFHATFWGHTDRWSDFFQQNACRTVSHEATDAETITACQNHFLETCLPQKKFAWGEAFLPAWDKLLPAIILRWAELFIKRCERRTSLTLIHGDAHLGNVMVPRNPDDAVPLLIDWEGLSIGLGAWDLARLIHHTNLDEATLVRFETLALKNYHRALMTSGATNYSEDDLQNDYRLSILAYVPHTLAWGNGANMGMAMRALERWNALNPASA